jgi:Domain of unknown function (DUF5659)
MHYETTDFNLAGYLYASGFKLAGHKTDCAQTIFCFEQTDTLKQRVESYFNLITCGKFPAIYDEIIK